MKRLILYIYFSFSTCLYGQSPIWQANDSIFDEGFSKIIPTKTDECLIVFSSQFHENNPPKHIALHNRLTIDNQGNIISYQQFDSSDYSGFYFLLSHLSKFSSHIYEFGELIDHENTERRLLIRKTNENGQIIKDSIFNLNNGYFQVNDALADNDTLYISGSYTDPNIGSYFLVIKLDSNFTIQDSVLFPFGSSYHFDFTLYLKADTLNVHASSFNYTEDFVIRYNKSTLEIIDTLHLMGNNGSWYFPNSYLMSYKDSVWIEIVAVLNQKSWDVISSIGWLVFDKDFNVKDTIIPFEDSLRSDLVGTVRTSLLIWDTLIIGYNHNSNFFGNPDSNSIGVLWSDINGNIYRNVNFGSGIRFTIENIHRFQNGNILVLSSGYNDFNFTQTDFEIWLLNASGDIISRIKLPDYKAINLSVYPNPTQDKLQIAINQQGVKVEKVVIFDINGREVLNKTFSDYLVDLNVNSLNKGIYMIKVIGNTGGVFNSKFIKE
jgi:hypothetical protein